MRTPFSALLGLLAVVPTTWAQTPYAEVVSALRERGLNSMEWVGRNFAGRECSVSFSEGAPRSNGVPRDLRFHISVDELDEGESPWNAIQGFTLREDALSISVTSSPQKLRLSATQTQATPPKGELKRFQYGVEVSFDSQDRVSRVLLDHNGRTTSCIIRYASLGL